jgi:hypothetical protein
LDRGLVGPRAGLDAVEERKFPCLFRKSNPVHPAHRPSLYRLSYLVVIMMMMMMMMIIIIIIIIIYSINCNDAA